jgi:glyoxylase-like metal-dependent hydrolase (beta-lactamase superfamily II)
MERGRYRRAQLAGVSNWAPVEADGKEWFGFHSVRALPGTRDDVLLIPLPGHTRGHCGVAARTAEGWLLHCGDACFHHTEVAPEGGATPPGLRFFESLANVDGAARRANRAQLQKLAFIHLGEVRLICSHDPAELAACRGEHSPAHRRGLFHIMGRT